MRGLSLLAAAGVCLTLFACGTVFSYENAKGKQNNEATVCDYVLGEYNGYIAVFCGDEPSEVFECKLSSLPEEEAQKLREGIHAKNEEELQLLIEAYTS